MMSVRVYSKRAPNSYTVRSYGLFVLNSVIVSLQRIARDAEGVEKITGHCTARPRYTMYCTSCIAYIAILYVAWPYIILALVGG